MGLTATERALGVGADPEDLEDEIPSAFLDGCNHDVEKARQRWQITKTWRRDNGIDDILQEPQPNFAIIKALYPHALIKQGKDGHWVYVERPGHAKLSAVWKSGMTMNTLERHYAFITEYLWRVVDPSPAPKLISIFDADGCALTDLAGDTLKMFQRCSGLLGAHYPERSGRIFIVNAPIWFKMAWSVISPFLDPITCKKIVIVKRGSDMMKELGKHIDLEDLPKCIGGQSPLDLGQSEAELALLEHVKKVNEAAGFPTDENFCVPEVSPRTMR